MEHARTTAHRIAAHAHAHAAQHQTDDGAAENGEHRSHLELGRKLHTISRLLHVVCHPVRLQILLTLAEGDRDVVRLEAETGHPGFRLLSPHLCKLRQNTLIKRWSLGGPPVYSLTAAGHELVRVARAIDGQPGSPQGSGGSPALEPELRLATPLLSHPARLRILSLLGERERETRQICDALGNLKLAAVSQHLSILRDAHLVRSRRQGKRNVYTLTEAGLRVLKARERGD